MQSVDRALTFFLCLCLTVVCAPARADIDAALEQSRDPNLQRLVAALRAQDTPPGALRDLVQRIDASDASPAEVLRTLRSLLPEVTRQNFLNERVHWSRPGFGARASGMPATSSSSSVAHRPTMADLFGYAGLASNASAGKVSNTLQPWLQIWHEDARQEDRDGLQGFDAQGKGLLIGTDIELSPHWSLAIAAGRSDADVDSAESGHDDQETSDFSISAYYNHNAHGFQVSTGYGKTETDRLRIIIVNPGAGPRRIPLTSDSDARQTRFSLDYAYSWQAGDHAWLTLSTGASWARLRTANYREDGPGDVSLTTESADQVQLTGSLGMDLAWFVQRKAWSWGPGLGLFYEHDFRTDPASTVATLGGRDIRFRTRGYDPKAGRLRATAGITAMHASGMGLSLNIVGQRKDDYRDFAVALTLSGRF